MLAQTAPMRRTRIARIRTLSRGLPRPAPARCPRLHLPDMFDHYLRVLKDRWLEPFARALGRRVSPNTVSVLACLVGLLAAWAASEGRRELALGCWLVNRTLDGFDGTLARVTGRQTDFGGYLDIVLDFVVYTVVPIGAAVGSGAAGWELALAWLLGAFFVNSASWMYLAAVLEKRAAGAASTGERTTVTMPPGLIAGTETILFFSLFLLLPTRVPLLMWVMAALVMLGVLGRMVWARRMLR